MNDHFQQDDDDDLWNQIYSYPYQENLLQDELLLLDQDASLVQKSTNPSTINEYKTSLPPSSTTPPPPPGGGGGGGSINDHGDKANVSTQDKKITRKEIERRRRQHISTLHSSLRSLLPVEYVKGKRSISDHMNEAVNYIEQLKTNIKELSVKRDELKKLAVRVSPWLETGVEVVISRGPGDEESGFLLSRVLHAVLDEGFEVVNLVSTTKNERLYDTIQCQASSNLAGIDAAMLEQKLKDVLASTRYIYKSKYTMHKNMGEAQETASIN